MTRASSIRRLPPELRDLIHQKLDQGATIAEIRAALADLGAEVSRSGLGRYKQRVDKVAARLRQSREMAETIVQKMGPQATEGKQGRFLVQMLTSITGDYMLRRINDDSGEDVGAEEIQRLARALKDTAAAGRYSQDFELKIREEARREAEAGLKKAVDTAARESGEKATPEEIFRRVQAIYRGEA